LVLPFFIIKNLLIFAFETKQRKIMLIVNQKQLNPNPPKDSELAPYAKEYREGIENLKQKFPTNNIQLKRNGFPKLNKSPDPNMADMPEMPSPMFIPLTRNVDGVSWGYCKGAPLIHANGLVEVPPRENSVILSGEVITLNLRSQPDYAFFIMYKSGILGAEFHVYDPEGDKLRSLTEKNYNLKVQYAIRESMDEPKLRMVCQAWGIVDAGTKDVLILQEELEGKVFAGEAQKKKNPTDLMLRGVPEFLADIRNDDAMRPKSIIQLAIDEKRLTFNAPQSRFYFDGDEVCYVPPDKQATRADYLANVLHDPKNEEKWLNILRSMVTKEYIDTSDKFGIRWLAGQLGVPLNKKEEALRESLLAEFATAD